METTLGGISASPDIPESMTNTGKIPLLKRVYRWYTYQVPFKRMVILVSIIFAIAILFAIGIYIYIIAHGYQKPETTKVTSTFTPTPTPTPITKIDPLTGVTYTGQSVSNLNRPPLAVMIENSISARPQTGLSQADIVYETLAEGGITRFMAVFLGNTPSLVGPVRSARTYFLDWVNEYNAIYAHWGQNSDVAPSLGPDGIRNIDAIFQPGTDQSCNSATGLFCRDESRDAPHNGYGFPQKIWNDGASSGWNLPSNFNQWTFKDDAVLANRGIDLSALNIDFMSDDPYYSVKWLYSRANNTYTRYDYGDTTLSQQDRLTGTPVTAKNIVVQFVNGNIYTSSGGKDVFHLDTTGTGKASIFLDGKEIDGSWKKISLTDRTMFYDQNNNPVQFNRGNTWITVLVTDSGTFSYK